MTRIAVAVSGTGSNLRALRAAERRGVLGGEIVLVLADRDCPALRFATDEEIPIAVVSRSEFPEPDAWDQVLAGRLIAMRIELLVLAGFLRILGPRALAALPARILNVHPSLLPAFPGTLAIEQAVAAGVRVTGVTVHLVDETLDGGPIVAQEAVLVTSGEPIETLTDRIHAVEHRLLPWCVALAASGALSVRAGSASIDATIAAELPRARRALLSVSDKTGLADLGGGLTELGFELVSTGGTARALREAGLEVTDVAAVTGFPEMLAGRVKTLHPRIEAGVLADLRLADHRAQLASAGIEPFEIVAVSLYPFESAAARPEIELDALIEEIDIGGPTLVRGAAKNHASVAVVTAPEDYAVVLGELRAGGRVTDATRRRLATSAFECIARYDQVIARELGRRLGAASSAGDEGTPGGFPDHLVIALERDAVLRYGENPHQAAALYVHPGADPASGPLATGARALQGKALSYNNLLDAAAAARIARDLRGHAVAIVKHGNPCGAAEAVDLLTAWDRALAGDPVSAFGAVVAVRGTVDETLAERLASLFLEVVVAAGFEPRARDVLAARPSLRLLEHPGLERPGTPPRELRSAGGAVLVTDPDAAPDDPAGWRSVTRREPTAAERADLDLAWRVCRHVSSNAIVLVRGGAVVGVGAGQMSRVDSARLAIAKAGEARAAGSVCASDAFFPFPDGVEACLAAGVTAVIQPGGSQRDADIIAAADAAGAAMLFTGVRHFRH